MATADLCRYKTTDFRTIFFWAWFVQGLSILPDLMLVSRANVALGLPDHAFMIGAPPSLFRSHHTNQQLVANCRFLVACACVFLLAESGDLSIGDQVFHQMLGQLKHLPFLVLAARICPDHVEATLFATIMAISNVGGDVASFWGAVLLDWLGARCFISFLNRPLGLSRCCQPCSGVRRSTAAFSGVFTGVTAKDFSMLWVAVLVRVLCCAIPAIAAFFLVPDGGPSDAVSDFQVRACSIACPNAAIASINSRASTQDNLILRESELASATTSQADIIAQAKRRTSQRALADEIPLNSAQTGVRSSRLHVGEDQEDAGDAKE